MTRSRAYRVGEEGRGGELCGMKGFFLDKIPQPVRRDPTRTGKLKEIF